MTTIPSMLGTSPTAAPESPFGLPLWLGIAVMFGVAVARGQSTYWIGRAAGAGFSGSRWADRIGRRRIARAEETVSRYGPLAVTVSFLTVGVQTAINFIAGTTRMPFSRYLPAMLAGAVLWAFVWTIGGLGIVWAWLSVAARSPVAAAGLAGVVVIVVVILVRRRRSRRDPATHPAGARQPAPTRQENR